MKTRIDRDGFGDAVAWTARILPQKAALPVLSGLRLEATWSWLTIKFRLSLSRLQNQLDSGSEPASSRVAATLPTVIF